MDSVNNTKFRVVSSLKNIAVPSGLKPRKILFGPYKGLTFNIDISYQTQFYLGMYEFETHPYIRRALHESRWLIDVGAGFGELCILFRRKSCYSIGIEPDAACLSIFRSNLALNGLSDSDIEVISKYVGNASDPDHLRLDDIDFDRSGTGFIKIDIEGFEMEALEGAVSLLKAGNVQLLIEVHSQELEHRCIEFLGKHQFSSKIVANSRWRYIVPEHRPTPHNRWLWVTPLNVA